MERSAAPITLTPSDVAPRPVEDHRRDYDSTTPLNVIEEDIARTRVRLSGTIAAIERELAPSRVLEKSRMTLRSALEPASGNFRQQVWAYAVPLALVLTGLSWLFELRRRTYRAEMLSTAGTTPAEEAELNETPAPAPSYTEVAGLVEPVSVIDENISN
jgi:hypothetical protein